MNYLIFILLMLLTFFLMEGITWLTHKYVMHGFLWSLHSDHHNPNHDKVFEKNDAFFFIFALPSFLLIFLGLKAGHLIPVFIGFGIALYGFAYFTIHDVLIHQRFKWFKNTKNPYLKAVVYAHGTHHQNFRKSYGMLYVPMSYIRKFKA